MIAVSVLVGSSIRISRYFKLLSLQGQKSRYRNKGERDKHENEDICESVC